MFIIQEKMQAKYFKNHVFLSYHYREIEEIDENQSNSPLFIFSLSISVIAL